MQQQRDDFHPFAIESDLSRVTQVSELRLPAYRSSHNSRFHPYTRASRPLDRGRSVSLNLYATTGGFLEYSMIWSDTAPAANEWSSTIANSDPRHESSCCSPRMSIAALIMYSLLSPSAIPSLSALLASVVKMTRTSQRWTCVLTRSKCPSAVQEEAWRK